jgi:hypothetical protein
VGKDSFSNNLDKYAQQDAEPQYKNITNAYSISGHQLFARLPLEISVLWIHVLETTIPLNVFQTVQIIFLSLEALLDSLIHLHMQISVTAFPIKILPFLFFFEGVKCASSIYCVTHISLLHPIT